MKNKRIVLLTGGIGTQLFQYVLMCYLRSKGYSVYYKDETHAYNTAYNGLELDKYFKININSIQAPGNPSDNFDRGEPIKPNSWIGVDIQIIPWEVIEEDHDL